MKRIILILLAASFVMAQNENQSQSIELPDFVITGKQKVTLPVMEKTKADPVQLSSYKVQFPSYTPEEFSLATVSKPEQNIAVLFPDVKKYNNRLILGAGRYVLPTGDFYFSQPLGNGIFFSNLWGINRKDFTDYSDLNESGAKIGSNFYINRNTHFLPGSIIGISGEYIRNEYRFYSPYRLTGSIPGTREMQRGKFDISLSNYTGDYFVFNFFTTGNFTDIKDADATEFDLRFNGETKFSFNNFGLVLNGLYRQQQVKISSGNDDYKFWRIVGGIEYSPTYKLKVSAGVAFYNTRVKELGTAQNQLIWNTTEKVSPWGKFEYQLNPYLTLSAGYRQWIEFKTYSDLLNENKYLYITDPNKPFEGAYNNSLNIYNHDVDFSIQFAYKKYYKVTLGGRYFEADQFSYYNSVTSSNTFGLSHMNKFKISRIPSSVTGYSVYGNALYHLGPFGWFYGDIKYQHVETDFEKIVPYNPKLLLNAAYGYDFSFGLSVEFKINYWNENYADITNVILLDDYINLSTELKYSLTDNFDFTLQLNNLLNRDNYHWLGYLEPPFDFIGGIDFRF